MRSRFLLVGLLVLVVGAFIVLVIPGAGAAPLTLPANLSCGEAVIDGNIEDWDLTMDYIHHMRNESNTATVGDVYMKYDGATSTAFIMVLLRTGYVLDTSSPAQQWAKIDGVTVVDGTSSDFAVINDGTNDVGWEASFLMTETGYSFLEAQALYGANQIALLHNAPYRVSTGSCVGCIGDYVWHDDNRNQIQDEPFNNGLSDITVRLFRQISPDVFGLVGETSTDANGVYLFCDLGPGNYQVDVHEPDLNRHFPSGWLSTTKNDPYPRQTDPPAGTESIELSQGEVYLNADFGYDDLGDLVSLGDYVWWDEDKDGQQNEPPDHAIACVTVWLYEDGNPNPIGQTNTDSWGIYRYDGLPTTAAPNGYSTAVDTNDPDIDNFIDYSNGNSATPTCNQVPEIFPTFTATTLMRPLAEITTPPTSTMEDSNIPGTTDITLDYAFWKSPTALSLASFEVYEASASPGPLTVAAAILLFLVGSGALLLRRWQAAK